MSCEIQTIPCCVDTCSNIITYSSQGYLERARTKWGTQIKCKDRLEGNSVQTRVCPDCSVVIKYFTHFYHDRAVTKNSFCKPCSVKGSRNPQYGLPKELTSFYGKTHANSSKEKMSSKRIEHFENLSSEDRKAFSEKMSEVVTTRQSENPVQSIHFYWTNLYGIEEADRRWKEFKDNLSVKMSGEGNPMYGKPSPSTSGNGYKGWYNGQFFRSLRELTFMLKNPQVATAESNRWRASYVDWDGISRTTVPDFVDELNKIVYECKPKKLHESPSVRNKATALEAHVEFLGYSYEIVDPGVLNTETLLQLIKSNNVLLTEKSKEKLEQWLLKNKPYSS